MRAAGSSSSRAFGALLERLRTPHKHSALVLAPSYKRGEYDSHAIDCPFVFRHDGRFYMTHVGWDGIGYRTGLASSDDLIHWPKEGLLIDRGPKGSTTEFNVALNWIVRDNDLFGDGRLKKIAGRYLGVYHAYPGAGYESGPGAIGLCWSDDLRNWQLREPFLRCDDGDPWERGGLYKSSLVEHDGRYYLFYNAKNVSTGPWIEQIGAVVSSDLEHWTRLAENPLVKVGPPGAFDDRFASDPYVVRAGDTWVMFYYGLCTDGHARDGAAFSRDLIHWHKANDVLVDVGPEGSIDSRYAHKPAVFHDSGRLYHYYCAVAPAPSGDMGEVEVGEIRGIGVAMSEPAVDRAPRSGAFCRDAARQTRRRAPARIGRGVHVPGEHHRRNDPEGGHGYEATGSGYDPRIRVLCHYSAGAAADEAIPRSHRGLEGADGCRLRAASRR